MDCSPPGSSVRRILQARILECVAISFSLLFTWGQTMVEVMKIMATSFKRSHAYTATLSAPDPAASHHQPMPLLKTSGNSQASLGQSLVTAPFCWVLVHRRFCVPSKSLFPQSCVSSGSSMVGLMATSFKSDYAIPKSAAPVPLWQSTADLYLHRRHSNTVLSQSLWGLWVMVYTRYV